MCLCSAVQQCLRGSIQAPAVTAGLAGAGTHGAHVRVRVSHTDLRTSLPQTQRHTGQGPPAALCTPTSAHSPHQPSVVIAKTRSFLLQRAGASAHARQTLRTETLHAAVTLPATSLAPARLFPPLLLTGLLQSACFPAQEGVSHLECSLLSHLSNKKKSFAHRCLFTLNMSL